MAAPGGLAGFLNSNKPQTNRPVIPKKQGFICSNSAARLSSLPPVDRKKKANSITLQDFNDEKAKDDEEVTPNLLNSLNLVPPSQMMEEEEKAEKEDKSEKKDKSKKKHKKHSKDKDKKEKKHKKHRKGKESKEEEETNEKEENEANSKGDTKPEENPETQQEEKSELEQEQEQTPEEPAQPEEPKKEEPAQPEEPQPAEIPKEEPKQEEPKKEEAPKIETKVSPKEAAREFLEKTTSRIWSQSPLDATKGIPKASAVLFAAIVESQILQTNKITDEKEFQEIADDFVSILKTRSVVERATLYDSLVVVLYLLKLIRGAEGDQNRKEYLSEKFAQEVCKPKFLEYIEENSIDLTSAAQCIVMCTVDNNSGISLIDLSMERILTKDPMFNGMKEAVKQMAIQLFDIQLLKNLLDNDYQIRFGNAVMWNQMFSVVNEEKNIDFTMFREAIGVMMMAQGICANPEVMIDVAPHLTPQFVYKVMESELPDDCLPLSNDTTTFVAFFNIDKSRSPEVSVFNYYDDFSEMIIDFPDNWRDVKVTFEDVKAFPFLSKYFKDEK
ncbi:hypothetical protein TRFO_24709 [Tritrichomonas foetus]|uniref:Uncharacterized protein n=1 Tax=Tritrichomonas foetus TaxID=1144522 RepID=A0A1J4K7S9_9EUKA|nr:hypothetical protein TRFO_24709 [Tritrichomonas foetus]|eukprot:OHT07058.1 hypothetical protein TRFO_24709 [Tritrichomonas foetus]